MDINKLPEKEKMKIEVIKSVFGGELDLLKILRKIILGLELTEEEKNRSSLITGNDRLVKIVEDSLNPYITGDEEIFMINDLWFQLNIKDKTKEDAIILMEAVRINEKFMVSALKRLKGETVSETINDLRYKDEQGDDVNLITVLARNIIISGLEGTLRGFQHLAGEKGETIEELAKRLNQNSSK